MNQRDMERSEHNQQILDQAAEWFVDVREGDVDARAQKDFVRWLRQSPDHIKAYLEVAAFWADVPQLASRQQFDVDALIAYASAEDNVVPLNPAQHHEEKSAAVSRSRPGRTRRLAIAASIATLALSAGSAMWLWSNRAPTYETAIGEQRSVTLADGSMIELNAKSRVRVRFSEHSRDIELSEGQALFTVAKDPSRPFIVSSDNTRVRAVGTQFVVYRRKSGTTVTVLEGTVSVVGTANASRPMTTEPARPSTGGANETKFPRDEKEPFFLSAGEQVVLSSRITSTSLEPADVAAATAWTQRQIVFQGAPLTDVVEEFNRYNLRQMTITDAGLETVKVSGVFSSTQPASLLRFLREQVGLNVTEHDAAIEISRR